MKKIIILIILLLCSCSTVEITSIPQLDKYGLECFAKPYTNKRDDQSLCMTSAIKKHHSQVDIINGMSK